MITIGVDPGNTGAFVALIPDSPPMLFPMPTVQIELTTKTRGGVKKKRNILDGAAIRAWLKQFDRNETEIIIELVGPMPGSQNGAAALFSFGENFGFLKGMFTGMGFRWSQVRPQRWQKTMLEGRAKGSESLVASELFPGVDWRLSGRCRKADSGLIDAALIAKYLERCRAQTIDKEFAEKYE